MFVTWKNPPKNDWVDFRVVQGDYVGTHNFGSTQTNLRLTFGFNFRFGQK